MNLDTNKDREHEEWKTWKLFLQRQESSEKL